MKVRQLEKTEEAMRRECEKRKVHWMPNGSFRIQVTLAESRIVPDKVSCENEFKRLGLRACCKSPRAREIHRIGSRKPSK